MQAKIGPKFGSQMFQNYKKTNEIEIKLGKMILRQDLYK